MASQSGTEKISEIKVVCRCSCRAEMHAVKMSTRLLRSCWVASLPPTKAADFSTVISCIRLQADHPKNLLLKGTLQRKTSWLFYGEDERGKGTPNIICIVLASRFVPQHTSNMLGELLGEATVLCRDTDI